MSSTATLPRLSVLTVTYTYVIIPSQGQWLVGIVVWRGQKFQPCETLWHKWLLTCLPPAYWHACVWREDS